MKKSILLFILILFFTTSKLYAQPGTLDNSFDGDGIVTTGFGETTYLTSMLVQKDSKILVAGYTGSKFVLLRYKPNGEMDKSFGTNGKVETKIAGSLNAMAIQSDGKIIVGGHSGHIVMARYLSNGLLDSSFDLDGIKFYPINESSGVHDLVVLPGDNILISGYSEYSNSDAHARCELILFNKNATTTIKRRTSNFYSEYSADITSLNIQQDSKIILSTPGYKGISVVRFNSDLTPDTSYNKHGGEYIQLDDKVNHSSPSPSVTQADGKILICGTKYSQSEIEFVLIRLKSGGGLDISFGDSGKVITNVNHNNNYHPTSIVLEPTGKILVAGMSHEKGVIIRYKMDGTLDSTFGVYGITTTAIGNHYQINCIAMQPDGNIVVAGNSKNPTFFDFSLARYFSGINLGILNPSDFKNKFTVYPNPIHQNTTLEYTLKNEEMISIQLVDMQGKLVKTFIQNEKQAQGEYKHDLSFPDGLACGNYFIQIISPSGQMGIKVLKE